MKTFGQKIREARKLMKMTQKELAVRIGAVHNSVSDWENDKSKPDPDTIEILCGVLGLTPNYLLGAGPAGPSPAENHFMEKYRALDEHGKRIVDYILDAEYARTIAMRETVSYLDDDSIVVYPYLGAVAAAGSAVYPGDIPIETIKARRMAGADFVVGISGDSMADAYHDGDKVYVKKTDELVPGEIGLFIVSGYYYVKVLARDGLKSLNPVWPMIPGDQDIIVVGKVLGKV